MWRNLWMFPSQEPSPSSQLSLFSFFFLLCIKHWAPKCKWQLLSSSTPGQRILRNNNTKNNINQKWFRIPCYVVCFAKCPWQYLMRCLIIWPRVVTQMTRYSHSQMLSLFFFILFSSNPIRTWFTPLNIQFDMKTRKNKRFFCFVVRLLLMREIRKKMVCFNVFNFFFLFILSFLLFRRRRRRFIQFFLANEQERYFIEKKRRCNRGEVGSRHASIFS